MTPTRWFAAVAVGCAAVAAILLPYPRVSPRSWAPPPPEPLAGAIRLRNEAAGEVQVAVRAYRSAQALERWSAASSASVSAAPLRLDSPVRLDSSVPAAIAGAARSAVLEQWARLGPGASSAHAEVFIYLDTTTIPRTKNATTSRLVIEPRRLVEVRFALPEATDGKRCVSLVRLRGTSTAHIDALRDTPVTGTCAFFAVFGLPGSGVERWLSSIDYALARHSDWDVARAPAIDGTSVYALGASGSRCLTGQRSACRDALGVSRAPGGTPESASEPGIAAVLDDSQIGRRAAEPRGVSALGTAEGRFFADAVRDLGPERFARFWRADAAPEVTFSAAAGSTLEDWTYGWLTRTYGAVPERPTVEAANVVWIAAAVPLLLALAARRRERVLTGNGFRQNR